jgi:hypothetical protein
MRSRRIGWGWFATCQSKRQCLPYSVRQWAHTCKEVKVLLKLNLSGLYPTVTASAVRRGGEQRKGNGQPAG